MKRGNVKRLALLLAGIMTFASVAGVQPVNVTAEEAATEEPKATLLFCSDFQTKEEIDPYENLSDVPVSLTSVFENISKTVYDAGFTKIDSVLMAGDYSSFIGQYNYDADPATAINVFQGIIEKQWSDVGDVLYIQGNHDDASYPYHEGANEYEEYIVYCVNTSYNSSQMGSFPWQQGLIYGTEKKVKLAAENMENYFDECIEEGENRPVFIMVHLPLHFNGRTTSLYNQGDNVYASCLFDVINSAAEDLDIVYLYGHNHSKGWDNYMGGSRVFKKPGDSILIPDASKKSGSVTDYYTEETLNFTYLNAGYIGYVSDYTASTEKTATVCEIYEDQLVLQRYSENGLVPLGANGAYNVLYNDSSFISSAQFSKEMKSPFELTLDRVKEPGVKLDDEQGFAGKLVSMHAVPKNMEAVSFTWSVSDDSVALLTPEGREVTIFGKKAGSTDVTVTVTDQDGNQYSDTATVVIREKDTMSMTRTEGFVSGEKYMLVGGSQDYSSVRPAVTSKTAYGNKGDGVIVLKGADVAGLDLSDPEDFAEAPQEYLWTVTIGEDDTVALYNEAAQKYLHFEQGKKSISLNDEPTYLEVMWAPYADSYGASGKAAAFHDGGWYLNYSDRQAGFGAYDAASYEQDGTHFTNQYAVYRIESEKDTLNLAITWAEPLKENTYTKETWSVLQTVLELANEVREKEAASQQEVNAAAGALLSAIQLLEEQKVTDVFDDVYSDWYINYVQYVFENSLMSGMKGTKHFAPNANITKAQVAQVLFNMEGQPEVEEKNVFTELNDVYEAEWYADAVAWAFDTGVVTGDTNAKKFFPNADVTREQLALMMYRYARYKEYPTSVSSDLAGLKNAENTADWAKDGVKWAVGAGLISGVEKNGVKDLQPQGMHPVHR